MDSSRWLGLLNRLKLNSDESMFHRLEAAYAEKHRAYHTAEHISDCLTVFDSHCAILNDKDAVELAIWFHDVIYSPYSQSNEEDSATLASEFLLAACASGQLISNVSRLIIATKHSVPLRSNDETQCSSAVE